MTQELLEQEFPAGEDGISQYMQQIRQFPLLSAQEEKQLAMACAQGDENAIRQLVSSNLALVVKAAQKYADRGIPLMDLIQEGSIGLLAAAKRFDYTRDNRFSTCAYPWIHGSIRKYLLEQESMIRLPQYTAEQKRKLQISRSRLLPILGREPTEQELAADSGICLDKVGKLQQSLPQICSLDATIGDEDDTLQQLLEDPQAPEPHRELVRAELKNTIDELLSRLTPRQQQVLKLRYGIDSDSCLSFDQIGAILGISKQRARQVESEAMEKLQKMGEAQGLEDFLT